MKEYKKPEIELIKFQSEAVANTGTMYDEEAGPVIPDDDE